MTEDQEDMRKARKIALSLGILALAWLAAAALLLTNFAPFMASIGQGVGLQDGAIYAFFLSTTLMVVLSLVAGDGLLGEVQYLITGFLILFGISWPLIVLLF